MTTLPYTPTPVQEIHHQILENAGVSLFVKREDLCHPLVSGNKWWKLKYNLAEAQAQNKPAILTFGGAFSNHIYATAAAAKALNLKSIGVIRGEATDPLNPTLRFAVEQGMELHYVSREDYRRKNDPQFLEQLQQRFRNCYIVPEGGSNALAVKGCEEFAKTLPNDIEVICLASGTGGTAAGIINGLPLGKQVIAFPALKGGSFLQHDIEAWLNHSTAHASWQIETRFHFGGYAKQTPELIDFIKDFAKNTGIMLDVVYTSKMMFGLFERIKEKSFPKGSRILAIHTGGLQGNPTDL